MGFIKRLILRIKNYIILKASKDRIIDILQIRTKSLNLTYVDLETDIQITNTFFLPIKILEINADVLNTSGLKVGILKYQNERKIKSNQKEIFTTHTQISNITAIFNLISKLLTLSITMRSVGWAKIKIFGFVVDVPFDDTFEILPNQLKIIEDLSPEEKAKLEEDKKIRKEMYEQRKAERKQKYLSKKAEREEKKRERMEEKLNKQNQKNLDNLDIIIDEESIKTIKNELEDNPENKD